MPSTQGIDSQFVLDLLNGSPTLVDFSALTEYLALLPPGLNSLRSWAKRFAKSTMLGILVSEAAPITQPSNPTGYVRIAQFTNDLMDRQWRLRKHSSVLPALASQLRGYIDQWIQTGYDEFPMETPWRRHLTGDLFNELNAYCLQNPLQVRVNAWGSESAWPIVRGNDQVFAWHEAHRLMIRVLGSDLRYAIAKCHKCETYFERTKLREVFKRGPYCPKHSKGAGTYIERDLEKKNLLELAAKFWSQWKSEKHLNRSLWVANKVNETRLVTQKRMTQKWVTRNRPAIEKLVREGDRDAKG